MYSSRARRVRSRLQPPLLSIIQLRSYKKKAAHYYFKAALLWVSIFDEAKKGKSDTDKFKVGFCGMESYASGCLHLFVDMIVAQLEDFSSKAGWTVKIGHQLFPVSIMTIMCIFSRHCILIDEFGQHCSKSEEYQEIWHALDPFS